VNSQTPYKNHKSGTVQTHFAAVLRIHLDENSARLTAVREIIGVNGSMKVL
jgi:hypothetical protein